jgi:ATP-dependent DNA helicase 2 subunit 1
MLALHEDPKYENAKTSRLLTALDAAVQIQKRKVVVGPYDSVGIMLYNTVRVYSRNVALSPVNDVPS